MPLSADGQALLELLLARGQSYADIGALLELSEAEVRQRAREALTELGGADPDRNVALTDWLLGQADPIGRADAARHIREDASDHQLAASLITALRELAPNAEFPRLPGEPSGGRFRRRGAAPHADADSPPPAPKPPKPRRKPRRLTSLDSQQSRLIFALGGAALLLIVVVLAIAGVFSGGDESSETTAGTTSTTATGGDSTTPAGPSGENTTSIPLRPVGGGDASGAVTIGLTTGDQGFVELSAENLQPPANGSTYYVWFMQDETTGYPYQPLQVEGSKATSQRFVLPNEALGVVLSARSIDVWISPISQLEKRIPQALQESTVVEIPGERVLSAPVQRAVEAAQGGGAGAGG